MNVSRMVPLCRPLPLTLLHARGRAENNGEGQVVKISAGMRERDPSPPAENVNVVFLRLPKLSVFIPRRPLREY